MKKKRARAQVLLTECNCIQSQSIKILPVTLIYVNYCFKVDDLLLSYTASLLMICQDTLREVKAKPTMEHL